MCVFIKHKYSYIKFILLIKYFLNDGNYNNDEIILGIYAYWNQYHYSTISYSIIHKNIKIKNLCQ